jgi:hypothetical protein
MTCHARPLLGVEAADNTGGRHEYRAARAVLSTIHVTHLRDMAPASSWPEEFHYSVDTYDVGIPGFGVYLAAGEPPVFEAPGNAGRTAVSAGTVGWPEDVIGPGADLRAGRFIDGVPWLLIATPTLADPTRARRATTRSSCSARTSTTCATGTWSRKSTPSASSPACARRRRTSPTT